MRIDVSPGSLLSRSFALPTAVSPSQTAVQSDIFARCGSVTRIVAVSSSPATSGAFSSQYRQCYSPSGIRFPIVNRLSDRTNLEYL